MLGQNAGVAQFLGYEIGLPYLDPAKLSSRNCIGWKNADTVQALPRYFNRLKSRAILLTHCTVAHLPIPTK
jgi:hypothetical protein